MLSTKVAVRVTGAVSLAPTVIVVPDTVTGVSWSLTASPVNRQSLFAVTGSAPEVAPVTDSLARIAALVTIGVSVVIGAMVRLSGVALCAAVTTKSTLEAPSYLAFFNVAVNIREGYPLKVMVKSEPIETFLSDLPPFSVTAESVQPSR